VVLWDATAPRRRPGAPPAPLGAAELERLWADLAAGDARTAYEAMCTLRAGPWQAVPLLERHLQPVPRADARQIADVLRNLDSDQFPLRDQAAKQLERMGEAAEPALRRVLAGEASEEVRRRVARLLDRLEGPNELRRGRALDVLESIGDAEARRLLTRLAQGAPQARLTREAQAALERLGRAR
jgi:hypothetical protein